VRCISVYAPGSYWFNRSTEPTVEMVRTKRMSTASLTVFYNGACPICRAEIRHYRTLAIRDQVRSLEWCDLSEQPEALVEHGLSADQAKRRLYTESAEGTLQSGVESFIAIWQRLPRYRWLARVARWPVIYPVAGWVYDRLAAPFLVWLNRRRENRSA
jgi:predicted DCC family thiol-disulfide oxidoreductase YuxK